MLYAKSGSTRLPLLLNECKNGRTIACLTRPVLFGQGSQPLHQAALPPGSVILMDDALLSGSVQSTNGLKSGLASFVSSASIERSTRTGYEGTGFTPEYTVVDAELLILPVTLDL
jgi:hypothetical protein